MKKTKSINIENIKTKNMNPKTYLAIAIFLMAIVCIPGIVSAEPEIQKISQWPYGTTHAVLGIENTFFMASGPSVWIFDATDHSNPVKIGEVNFESVVYGLAAEGDYLYVANGQLRIVDISDLSNPVLVGNCLDCSAKDVKIVGDYAFVVGILDDSWKLQVINISDKSNPVKIGECSAGSKRLDISGNYAYVAAEASGLKIIDISDPSNPTQVGTWAIPSEHRAFGVKVKGNYAYIADYAYGIWSIDVSNPANPVDVSFAGGTYYGSYEMDDLDIKGDYAYASCWYRGLIAIDISDPTNISIARQIPSTIGDKDMLGYNEGEVSISGNYAYMGGHYSGAGIYDISTPLSEELLRIVDAYGRSFSLAYRDNYTYVTTDNGLVIINVSDTANPVLVSKTSLGGRSAAITLNDDYAYGGATWAGLGIVNISDPTNLQTYNYGNGYGSSIFHEGYLHALQRVGYVGYYKILDVSDPADVKEVYSFNLLASYTGLVGTFAIKDNYSYVGLTSKNGLQILDISDPEDITEAGIWLSGDNVNGITIQGNYIYVRTGSELIVGDISSEPANPVELDSWSFSGQYYMSTGPNLWQNYLFLAGNSGVLIFDNSDPENISFLKQYDEVADINDLYFTEDGFMYAAAYEHGVYILKFIPESDGIPPVITNVNAAAQIHSAIITWDTDEQPDSLVKYGTSSGSYTMQASDSSFVLSHSITLTGLSGQETYYYVVNSTDYSGNSAQSSEQTFTTLADIAPPVITIVNPENAAELAGGTQSVNVTITTDEPAWCQYSTSDFEYGEGIDFTTGQGTTEHSFILNLQDGESYTFYYRCTDSAGNKNTVSAVHTFTTATKWWDYFDDETKIGIYEGLVINGSFEIILPENKVSLTKDVSIYSIDNDVGYNDRSCIGSNDWWRQLIEFTMPYTSGEIESIKLYLYKYDTVYESYNHTINLHKLNGSFVEEQATWNSRSSGQPWTNPGAEGDYDSTIIDHLDCSGDTPEWYVWTIKGAGADNSLDPLTSGDTVAFILKQAVVSARTDKYNAREASSNIPFIEITLSGSVSDSLISTPISPTSISSWDKFNTNHSTPAGTSISYSILDAQTDAVLCSGLTGNNDDISGCLTGVSSIKLKVELTTTNPSDTPVLYDWEVSWKRGELTPETTPPETTYVITPSPDDNGWLNTSATVTFFRNSGVGIAYTNYSMYSETGPWTTVSTSTAVGPDAEDVTDITEDCFNVTVSDEGVTEIWFYSVDSNSNVEQPTKKMTVKIKTGKIVGEWRFDDETGEIAEDTSGNTNTGILTNMNLATAWVPGKPGTALQFDGIDDYVDCGNDASLDITDAITIELWLNPNVAGEGGTNAGPVAKAETGGDWSWQLRYNAPGGYMGFQFNGDPEGSTWVSVNQNLTPGEWYHIAGTFDGTTIRCYLNGLETDTNQISAIKSGNATLFIGQDGWGNVFNGKIDEVKIYNSALTVDEVRADYEGGLDATANSLSGTVTGPDTAGIANANVTLTTVEGTEINTTQTDITGNYTFTDIFAGTYNLTVTKQRFWPANNITVTTGNTENIMLWLKGDLNLNGTQADSGDLLMMDYAATGRLIPDWKFDLNGNGDLADAGDVLMLEEAAAGKIELG